MKTNVNEITQLIENLIVKETNFTNKSLLLSQDDLNADDIQRQADTLREANLWMWDEARGKFESLIYNVVLELEVSETDADTGITSTSKKWQITDIINYKKGVLGFLSEQGELDENGEIRPFLNPVYIRYWTDAMVRLAEYWFSNGFTLSTEPSRSITHDFSDSSLHSVQVEKDESGIYMPTDVVRLLELGQFHNWKVKEEVWTEKAYYEEWVTRPEFDSLRTRVDSLQTQINELNNVIEAIKVGKLSSDLIDIKDPATEVPVPPTNPDEKVTAQETFRQIKIRVDHIIPLANGAMRYTFSTDDGSKQFSIEVTPESDDVDFDGLKASNLVIEKLGLLQSDNAAEMITYVDVSGEVITEFNGVGKLEVNNLFASEDVEASSFTLNGVKITKWPTLEDIKFKDGVSVSNVNWSDKVDVTALDTLRVPDDRVDITTLFGTGNIDPKTLKEFLEWIALHFNGGVNQTNKLNFYLNDNDELELRYDETPIMLFENGKVNYLNQGLELIGDSNNPLSALNTNQIKTLINQLIATASLTEDKVFYKNDTINNLTDANGNDYIKFTSDIVDIYLTEDTTTGFVQTESARYFLPTTQNTSMLGFELLIGGEEFDTLMGAPTNEDYYWNEYLAIPTLALGKKTDWTINHNIFGKKPDGTFYIKNQAQITLNYLLVKSDGVYKLELREFVEYTIKTYNTSGDLTKTDTGTQYLNDSALTLDKQPLRIYIGATGYVSVGSSIDLSDYYNKLEVDNKLALKADKTYIDTELEKKVDKKYTFNSGTIFNIAKSDEGNNFEVLHLKIYANETDYQNETELGHFVIGVRKVDGDYRGVLRAPTSIETYVSDVKDYTTKGFSDDNYAPITAIRKLATKLGLKENEIADILKGGKND